MQKNSSNDVVKKASIKGVDRSVKSAELRRLFDKYSAVSVATDEQSAVLKGFFHHNLNCDGLSVHAGQLLEMQDMSTLVELPPALSFNIVFEGLVDFSVGKNRYQLGKNLDSSVECSAIILNQPEVMARRFRKGMRVSKLNLFAERQWLEKRTTTAVERERLASLFAKHNAFRYWQPSSQVIHLAECLMAISGQSSLDSCLKAESLAIELLACCLRELYTVSAVAEPLSQLSREVSQRDKQLKQRIDELLLESISLAEIARALGLSISTLQRKFKAAYGVTVTNYCRQRRLDRARKALLMEGKSIGEAAYLAGYSHPSNFISAFKKRFDLTPSELVNLNQL